MQKHSLIQNKAEINLLFNVFFDYVRLLIDIPEEDQAYCRQFFKPIFAPKDSLLEKEGTVPQYHNFIVSGYIRNFYHDKEEREVTIDINDGPRFFTSFHHFIQQSVSNENLHCITDCQLLRISRADMLKAKDLGITSQAYSQKILQHHLESSKQRIINLSTLTAKERYLKLIQEHPAIIKNIPLTYWE